MLFTRVVDAIRVYTFPKLRLVLSPTKNENKNKKRNANDTRKPYVVFYIQCVCGLQTYTHLMGRGYYFSMCYKINMCDITGKVNTPSCYL